MKGFTILEILIVVALIAMFALLHGMFVTGQSVRTSELERARELARSELVRTRSDTIHAQGDAEWGVAFFEHSIVRFQGTNYSSRNPDYDAVTQIAESVTISGISEIAFTRPEGIPSIAGDIIITEGTRIYTINVNGVGTISIE